MASVDPCIRPISSSTLPDFSQLSLTFQFVSFPRFLLCLPQSHIDLPQTSSAFSDLLGAGTALANHPRSSSLHDSLDFFLNLLRPSSTLFDVPIRPIRAIHVIHPGPSFKSDDDYDDLDDPENAPRLPVTGILPADGQSGVCECHCYLDYKMRINQLQGVNKYLCQGSGRQIKKYFPQRWIYS
jgi:hypothetical protein